jgi:hypothetical protein
MRVHPDIVDMLRGKIPVPRSFDEARGKIKAAKLEAAARGEKAEAVTVKIPRLGTGMAMHPMQLQNAQKLKSDSPVRIDPSLSL